jgi:16S rRNA G966 N2-methylase RsmD
VFNMLRCQSRDAAFLDLFSGSGVMGLTALSEGFAPVFLCEKEGLARRAIERSLGELSLRGTVLEDFRLLSRQPLDRPWIAYLDPPFAQPGLAHEALELLRALEWQRESRVFLEFDCQQIPMPCPGWRHSGMRTFGRIALYELLPE